VRGLHLEQRREQRLEHEPLVQPQAVHDDEHRRPLPVEHGEHELGEDVHRQRRPVPLEVREPGRVGAHHELRELAVHVGVERAQRVVQPGLARLGEVHVPAHELREAVDPAAPLLRPHAVELDLAEALGEGAGDGLLPDPRPLEHARDDRVDLPRVHRLDEVLAHVGADRLAERRVLLALRHHHDGERRRQLADLAVRLEPPLAGHLLVEQHEVVGPAAEHLDGVVRVEGPLHLVALLSQEQAV
jgi:hypothetical protein